MKTNKSIITQEIKEEINSIAIEEFEESGGDLDLETLRERVAYILREYHSPEVCKEARKIIKETCINTINNSIE